MLYSGQRAASKARNMTSQHQIGRLLKEAQGLMMLVGTRLAESSCKLRQEPCLASRQRQDPAWGRGPAACCPRCLRQTGEGGVRTRGQCACPHGTKNLCSFEDYKTRGRRAALHITAELMQHRSLLLL